eukprot:1175408-Prorocentrum_minimum.AAC.4
MINLQREEQSEQALRLGMLFLLNGLFLQSSQTLSSPLLVVAAFSRLSWVSRFQRASSPGGLRQRGSAETCSSKGLRYPGYLIPDRGSARRGS